jgi:hypothetical protein
MTATGVAMTCKITRLTLDELDLGHVAEILNDVFPHYSLCDCARMAAEFAPETGCVCSLCAPGTYPACVRRERGAAPSPGPAMSTG